MAPSEPPRRPTGGTGVLLILILLIAVAGLAFAAWTGSADDAPNPSATGVPQTLPAGGATPGH
ncbi:MAG: hypothetical protein E6G94_06800 [Alphaproteobacteria bacterium]|nr:MAG: hypothetical protein E6G94_06800 [Alphaproteobacteria bacterium]